MTKLSEKTLKMFDKIGEQVHSLFRKQIYENILDKEIITIFEYLETYWFDSYRTSLIWFCNKIVGGNPEKTIIPSLIMSLTSSGIGIHDDVIDKTKYKKIQKTIPVVFGEEKAIIAGDLLIIKGILCTRLLLEEFDKETYQELTDVLDEYFMEMAVGESQEISANKNLDLELEDYFDMLWKLGADGRACTLLGAISGNGTTEQLEALGIIGRALGYIIRLNDEIKDILNVEGTLENRIKNESIPLAMLYISKKSEKHYNKIHEILVKDSISPEDITNIIEMSYEVDVFQYINSKIDEAYKEAEKAMNIFEYSDAKIKLFTLLNLKKDSKKLVY